MKEKYLRKLIKGRILKEYDRGIKESRKRLRKKGVIFPYESYSK